MVDLQERLDGGKTQEDGDEDPPVFSLSVTKPVAPGLANPRATVFQG
jgi:hypothetical protein